MNEEHEVIVIGSGMGGLGAAAMLSQGGLKPLVLEHHFIAGGNAQTFRRRKMFDFDVGFHYIGDCGPDGTFPALLKRMGIEDEIEFLPMDPDGFDTLIFPDLTFRMPAGWERYRQRLYDAFPGESRAIDRYIDFAKHAASSRGESAEQPEVSRRLGKPMADWTLADVFDALECSGRLRAVLASLSGTYGAPPSRASAMMHAFLQEHYLRSGGYFIRGGGRSLVEAMVRAVDKGGGEVRLRSRVHKVLVEDGKVAGVELANGQVLRSKLVISNADVKRTLLEMVGAEHLDAQTVEKAGRARMSLPLFVTYIAMKRDPMELGIPNTNYGLSSSYDVEEAYAQCYAGEIPEKPGVGMIIASRKDPQSRNIAPPGYTNLQLMTIAPASLRTWGVDKSPAEGGRYRHTVDYEIAKKLLEERMLAQVERMMPGFIRDIVWKESATPLTQERFTLSTGGTSYGLEHAPDQFRSGRFAPQTEIEGLYLVGASGMFGHGITGSMVSGVATAGSILAGR
jgi:phytoene dehydrogenase-like protein